MLHFFYFIWQSYLEKWPGYKAKDGCLYIVAMIHAHIVIIVMANSPRLVPRESLRGNQLLQVFLLAIQVLCNLVKGFSSKLLMSSGRSQNGKQLRNSRIKQATLSHQSLFQHWRSYFFSSPQQLEITNFIGY